MPEEEKKSHSSRNRLVLSIVFLCACLAGLLIYLFASGDASKLPGAFEWPRSAWLFLGIALMIGGWTFESWVMWSMARGLKQKIPFKASFRSIMVIQFFNNVTPFAAAGQPMQIWSLWRDGVPVGEAASVQIGKFSIYQSVLTLCSVGAMLIDYPSLASSIGAWVWIIVLAFIWQMVLLVFLITMITKPALIRSLVKTIDRLFAKTRWTEKSEGFFAKVYVELDHFEESSHCLTGHPAVFLRTGILTFIQLQLFFSVPFCVCNALGVHPPLIDSMACAAFVLMVTTVMPLPGGTGGAEGSFALVFMLFFPEGTSVAVAILLWRMLTFYLPVLAGAPFCIGSGRERDTAAKAAGPKGSKADGSVKGMRKE